MIEILQKLMRRVALIRSRKVLMRLRLVVRSLTVPTSASTHPYEFNQWLRGFNVVRRRQIDDALKASGRKTVSQWAA
jgi:hypothetical protein